MEMKWMLLCKLFLYKFLAKLIPWRKAKFLYKSHKYYVKLHPVRYQGYNYVSHYEESQDFSNCRSDIKTFVYYLPQFHIIEENNAWWGKNFTEWTNTTKSLPYLKNHYQPRTPHKDIGYYDLSDADTIRRQAALAKSNGIFGFCIYYYWFSGKKLLEKPLDLILANLDIDLTFCLCWANESWGRSWTGRDKEFLIEQKYLDSDPLHFIEDLAPYLRDKRYFRKNGKPVILIYRTMDIPNQEKTFKIWRDFCLANEIGEIEIWAVRAHLSSVDFSFGSLVDREVEFPPHQCTDVKISAFDIGADNLMLDYHEISEAIMDKNLTYNFPDYPIVRTAMLGWDNSARKKKGAVIFNNFSLYQYFKWLRYLIGYTREQFAENDRYLFINAWNEWAEGTYLEPDEKYGYASIKLHCQFNCATSCKKA